MLKRFVYGGVFALVFIGLIVIIILKRTDSITPATLFEVIPEDAVIIIEQIDYDFFSNEFITENQIYRDLLKASGFSVRDSLMGIILKEVSENEGLKKILNKERPGLSLHLIGKAKLMPVIYIDYSDYYSSKDFVNLFTAFLVDDAIINERRYEAETIYEASCREDYLPDNLSFACLKGIFLLSPSSLLIEESIRGLHSGRSYVSDKGFQRVRSTSGRNVYANTYLNYAILDQIFFPYVNHNHWSGLNNFTDFADWGELDVDIRDDVVILNGMSCASDSVHQFLSSFTEQFPVKVQLTGIFPSNTFYFLHLGFDKKEEFYKRMLMHLAESGERVKFDEETDRIKRTYGLDPFRDLLEIVDDEIAWFSVEGSSDALTSKLFVIESKSGSLAKAKLHNWYQQYIHVNKFDPASLIYQYKLDNQTSFDIYRMPDQFYEKQKAGNFFNRYYTIYDKYVLFGPNIESLSAVIYQNVLRKTLDRDPVFEEVSNYFSSRSNISVFIKPYLFLQNHSEILKGDILSIINGSESFLRKMSGMVMQYSRESDMYYSNVTLKYTSNIKERALTVWESLLDTAAFVKPSLVTNHATSEKEIFIQDAKNKIYLINGAGRILWSLPLEGPVMSDIYQIDFYKNNKLQYLFNTKEKLHLIDRNGNYVERYPVNLRSHATNGISLFDYDKNRDYRIFVAGLDRNIYVYDQGGNVVTGWKFRKTEGLVTKPVQHFRIDDKDYIIVNDSLRIYVLDRKGKERVKPEEHVAVSRNNILYLDMNIREGKPRWITTDTNGNIVCIYTGGEVETLIARQAPADHYFIMQDMDRDGIPDFLVTDGNEMKVLNASGSQLFSFKTKGSMTLQPDIYKFSASDIKIGITDPENGKIFLINSNGSLHEGFPLDGKTRFSIGYFAGSNSRFNLVVGGSNSFLYNYSIE